MEEPTYKHVISEEQMKQIQEAGERATEDLMKRLAEAPIILLINGEVYKPND